MCARGLRHSAERARPAATVRGDTAPPPRLGRATSAPGGGATSSHTTAAGRHAADLSRGERGHIPTGPAKNAARRRRRDKVDTTRSRPATALNLDLGPDQFIFGAKLSEGARRWPSTAAPVSAGAPLARRGPRRPANRLASANAFQNKVVHLKMSPMRSVVVVLRRRSLGALSSERRDCSRRCSCCLLLLSSSPSSWSSLRRPRCTIFVLCKRSPANARRRRSRDDLI
jgi:hypothetical protein